jgi:di/tricarboxylate transporter
MESIQGKLLVLVSSSLGLALAVERTGVAANFARALSAIFNSGGAYTQLMGIYLATTIVTSFVSSSAAASVMYPVVVSMVAETGLSLKAAIYTLMISASFAYETPIEYQTNIIVQGAAGYGWYDFLKFGGPLTFICMCITPLICIRQFILLLPI